MTAAPGKPLVAFYGDDFTGSSDALEVLAFAGLKAVMFLAPPTAEMLARFPGLDAIGFAGDSRGMSVAEMDAAMPAILSALRDTGAGIVHYKVCSTFDSSPETGSIGRIIMIAREIFQNAYTPIVGATPALARYCVFGNLFARSGTDGEVYRIDRHPIMSVHPVTPMQEGDLARHIAQQAPLQIASLGCPSLDAGEEEARLALARIKARQPDCILFDSASSRQLTEVGRLLDEAMHDDAPLFVVGGSGVEYALTQWWAETAPLPAAASFDSFDAVDRLLVMSGSASRMTADQIDAAIAAGFVEVAVDARDLMDGGEAALDRLVAHVLAILKEGRSPLVHTVRGPNDPRIVALREAAGLDPAVVGRALGQTMGRALAGIQARAGLTRIVVSGGDTSSQAVQVLGPDALEIAARLAPGVPLCRMHAAGRPSVDGVQIALKGGQMGGIDFFERARTGR